MLVSEHRSPLAVHECGGILVDTVVRYQVGDGSSVLVEVDEDTYGVEAVSRTSDGVLAAGQRLESALASVRDAAQAALETMSKLSPEKVEVEVGTHMGADHAGVIAPGQTQRPSIRPLQAEIIAARCGARRRTGTSHLEGRPEAPAGPDPSRILTSPAAPAGSTAQGFRGTPAQRCPAHAARTAGRYSPRNRRCRALPCCARNRRGACTWT